MLKDAKITYIYGPTGTGKTTIANALAAAAKCTAKVLDDETPKMIVVEWAAKNHSAVFVCAYDLPADPRLAEAIDQYIYTGSPTCLTRK